MIINLTDIEAAPVKHNATGTAYKSIRKGNQRVVIVLATSDPDNLREVLDVLAEQGNTRTCEGHPAGPFDPMGQTVYCDGTCK